MSVFLQKDQCPLIRTTSLSMGSVGWKGDALIRGYHTYIAGKEVELDSQIKKSQLPTIAGLSIDDTPHSKDLPLPVPSDSSIATPPAAKFIAPVSFYGTTVTRKSKGPLLV